MAKSSASLLVLPYLALGLLALSPGCWRREAPPNVLLLVVDTLRADHLGLYGYPRPTSPELDRFARSSIVFDPVVAASSWTLPSVASILTSTYPSVHGLRSRTGPKTSTRVRAGLTTLTEVLANAGYRTAAVGTNPWVNTQGHGLQQGFETYETALREPADFVHSRARRILEADDPRPVFLYLHYMDVHGPYVAQRDESLPTLGPVEERARRPLTRAEKKKVPSYLRIPKARTVSGYVDAYDRGIQIWDRSFGEFARWLDETGRLGNTIVVIVSDHGEELLEHGGWNHGLTVFEEQIYVPWILRIPGEAGRRIDGAAVSLIDVGPSLLEVLDLPVPASMAGRNALVEDPDGAMRAAFSETQIYPGASFRDEGTAVVAMRRGDRKWILGPKGDRCFDLGKDPSELEGEDCDEAGLAQARQWAETVTQQGEALGKNEEFEISDEQRALLEELGYGN